MREIEVVIETVGYDKAVKELVKQGLCPSKAAARREVRYHKIANGEREVKDFGESK